MRDATVGLLLVCGVLSQAPVVAAGVSCLADAGDAAQLDALRDVVETTCPCSAFTGMPDQGRRDYLKCAKAVVKNAVSGGGLPSRCKAAATYPISKSICGYPPTKPRVPCIRTSKSGKVSCKVTSPVSCDPSHGVACPVHDDCLDAADTNHDRRVGAGDSGACTPLVECFNPPRPDGAACNDGVACTQNDTCSGHVCGGTAYACDAPDACQEPGTCNGDGTCAFAAKPDGTTCDVGQDVRPPLVCTAGTCGACAQSGTCSTTSTRACGSDGDCPAGETCGGSAPAPRFVDNQNGTVTDRQTCLVWEKKGGFDGTPVACPGGVSCGDPHDADNVYAWSTNSVLYGPLFTDFLPALNGATFAGHADWRVPGDIRAGAPSELASLVDATASGCGSGGACAAAALTAGCTPTCSGTDPSCSCTAPADYWTATRDGVPNAFTVDFADGSGGSTDRLTALAARAVRGGIPYLDCATVGAAAQSVANQLVDTCYRGCSIILNDECVSGCLSAYFPLGDLVRAGDDVCHSDPAGACDAYAAGLAAYCPTVPNPPTKCVENCFGDAYCQERCTTTSNCAAAAQAMVAACRAQEP